MKKIIIVLLSVSILISPALAQTDTVAYYKKTTAMIPMRDGVKLFTVIFRPINNTSTFPILIQRTPYGSDQPIPEDTLISAKELGTWYTLAKDGYFFVIQDIRGKYKSEGNMQIHQPLIHTIKQGAIDESTDTYDAVDWLIKNIDNNNGNVGIFGVSYPGWLALVGSVDPHPALKASSEQACMGDLFLGDDFHHNGAFRLSYGLEYTYEIEHDKSTDSEFPFPQYDLFDWYLKLGPLKNVNDKYFHSAIPTWNNFVKHPDYDAFWQTNSPLSYISYPQIPQLHVGGYYDQEDINGPQLLYGHLEKKDTFGRNHIVLGPWNHGQWARSNADSLGKITFEQKTGVWFRQLQKKWFDYWLKGKGDGKFQEAYCFQTGNNQWKTYNSWPPAEGKIKKLYAGADNKASFVQKPATQKYISFISDPDKPVPYRTLPIEMTYGPGSRWKTWQVEDQRFVYTRPDVISFIMDSLNEDLIVTGKITAHLCASTAGSDADWIVKLIDQYPAIDPTNLSMSGYQLPVAMEILRGRYRKSFSNPSPLIPNKPEAFNIDLHQINHCFRKGHKIMIQVQSSWFPLIDRNPQKYVRSIYEARAKDFIKAEHRIYFSSTYPTYIELPVMEN